MTDPFSSQLTGLDSPARDAAAVTPSDTVDLNPVCRSLWIGVSGNVKVLTSKGDTVTFVGVSGVLPVCVKRVFATDTTATSIVALW